MSHELRKITIITNISIVACSRRIGFRRHPGHARGVRGAAKSTVVLGLSDEVRDKLGLPSNWTTVKFANGTSRSERGSPLNANFEGGYNVSYFTPRAQG